MQIGTGWANSTAVRIAAHLGHTETVAKNPTGFTKPDQFAAQFQNLAFLDPKSRRDFGKYENELPSSNVKGRAVTLGHELGHDTGAKDENKYGGTNVDRNENPIRQDLGLSDRPSYAGHDGPRKMGE